MTRNRSVGRVAMHGTANPTTGVRFPHGTPTTGKYQRIADIIAQLVEQGWSEGNAWIAATQAEECDGMSDVQSADYVADDTALRHRIYNSTTDALRTELAGIVNKNVALLIAWELQRRGEGYRWPLRQARQQ